MSEKGVNLATAFLAAALVISPLYFVSKKVCVDTQTSEIDTMSVILSINPQGCSDTLSLREVGGRYFGFKAYLNPF